MSNAALQLSHTNNGSVSPGMNIPFNNTLFLAGDISYNPSTGIITLNSPGRYVVQWWAAIQSTISSTQLVFAVNVNGALTTSSSPLKADQVGGTSILEVVTVPATVALQGASAADVFFSTVTPVKAGLTLVQDDDVLEPAFGGLYNDEILFLPLPGGGTEVTVELGEELTSQNVILGTNSITITLPGTYRLDYTMITSTADEGLSTAIAVNGVAEFSTAQSHVLSPTTQTNISCFTILQLAAGDVVTLVAWSVNAFSLLLGPGQNAALSAIRIAP